MATRTQETSAGLTGAPGGAEAPGRTPMAEGVGVPGGAPDADLDPGITDLDAEGAAEEDVAVVVTEVEEVTEVDAPGAPEVGYRLPFLGMRVPEPAVDAAFWVGLAGVAVVGAVDLPVAALVAAGVVVARHRRRL